MSDGRQDLGVLISIICSAPPQTWQNVLHSLESLRPVWSSLAIDAWDRPLNESVLDVRRSIFARYGQVLALFSRVLFLDTASRRALPGHIRPSFSYRLHWHAAFADPLSLQTFGPHSEGLPEVLAGLDADVYVPRHLPVAKISRTLSMFGPTTDEVSISNAEERAFRAWVLGRQPVCENADSRHKRGTQRSAANSNHSLCEIVTPSHSPLYVSPHSLSLLERERGMSRSELGNLLLPQKLGNCCGRQNIDSSPRLRTASGASVATLSRGPWCPSSAFFMLHRRSLKRHLNGLRIWQEAFDRHSQAAWKRLKLMRWEYLGCGLLAPGESILMAYYNHTELDQ